MPTNKLGASAVSEAKFFAPFLILFVSYYYNFLLNKFWKGPVSGFSGDGLLPMLENSSSGEYYLYSSVLPSQYSPVLIKTPKMKMEQRKLLIYIFFSLNF